jgi:hypothetical protein
VQERIILEVSEKKATPSTSSVSKNEKPRPHPSCMSMSIPEDSIKNIAACIKWAPLSRWRYENGTLNIESVVWSRRTGYKDIRKLHIIAPLIEGKDVKKTCLYRNRPIRYVLSLIKGCKYRSELYFIDEDIMMWSIDYEESTLTLYLCNISEK